MSDINNRDDQGREDLEDLNTDENIAGATHLDISAREEETERLKDELQEQKDKYLRLFAEFDNFRKRSARENLEL
ncbi:MAG TPA: nucleotide exchange factor GrpE, partial [Puia sp.]|nr:nucleotide exchange factor GrpE [Puia sp.]